MTPLPCPATPTPRADPAACAAPAWRRRLGAGLLLLGLCACAGPTQPPGAVPLALAVPTAWSDAPTGSGAPATPLAQWWLRFGDPLLTSLIEQALAANTSVQSAQAAVRGARAQRDVAAAALWPGLSATASAQRNRGNSGSSNSASAGLDASWELDLFGANRSALEAGNATLRASAASLGDVQVSLAAEVAISYIALRGAQARLAIAQSNLDSQKETLQITAWRQQAGLVTAIDLEQARGAVAQTSAQLPALRTTVEQARHALAVLTGQAPDALAQTLAAAQPVPRAPDELALAIPADTLRQRPDVRAAEQQAMAAAHKLSAADAALLPSLRLGGSLGLNAVTGNTSVVSALLASLSAPLFDGGALRAQTRVQQAALEQARLAYQAAVLTALKDVGDALVALRGDRERLARLQLAAASAVSAAELARLRYGSGLVDFQTVLETQRTQLSTQDGVASATADVSADQVRLFKALGGGWQAQAGAAITPGQVSDTSPGNASQPRVSPL